MCQAASRYHLALSARTSAAAAAIAAAAATAILERPCSIEYRTECRVKATPFNDDFPSTIAHTRPSQKVAICENNERADPL